MAVPRASCGSCARSLGEAFVGVLLEVEHRETGERRELRRRSFCAGKPHAAWRLTWAPVREEAEA